MWDNLGRVAAEYPHLRNIRVFEPGGRVETHRDPGTIDTDMGDQVLVTRARNLGTNDIEAARRCGRYRGDW